MIKLSRLEDQWVAFTDGPADRWPVKSAGFRYSPPDRAPVKGQHVWHSKSDDAALKVREFADDAAKILLEGIEADREGAVVASHAQDADIEIPAPEGLAYLPFQRAGIAFAASRNNVLIADEMGLGKTIQAIGAVNLDSSIEKVLVLCPASLKLNWAREFEKWSVRSADIRIAKGKEWKQYSQPEAPELLVQIINFDILKKHGDHLRAFEHDLLIIDEAHFLKNPKAQRSKEALGAKKRVDGKWVDAPAPIPARRVIALSGTPIVNRPIESYPILHRLDGESFNSVMAYAKRYCAAYHGRFGWDFSGASNLDELQAKLRSSVMIRRLKADVLVDLPPKRRQVIELPSNGSIAVIAAERKVGDELIKLQDELAARVALAEASDDPSVYADRIQLLKSNISLVLEEISRLRHDTAVAKVPMVIEHLRSALDQSGKVVCFAHHVDVVDALMAEFGDIAVKVTGSVSMDARQVNVDAFQNDPEVRLFVGNIQAAGVGLTLTAASHVVFAELDWVPGNVSQAEDRCHRIGQVDSVLVQHLVLEDSLDALMAQRLVAKQKVIDAALDNDIDGISLVPDVVASREQIEQQDDEIAARRAKQAKEMAKLNVTPALHASVLMALQVVAGVCDGAVAEDGQGFNGRDAIIGHDLAGREKLSPKQVVLGRKIVMKYKRQYPSELFDIMMASKKEAK